MLEDVENTLQAGVHREEGHGVARTRATAAGTAARTTPLVARAGGGKRGDGWATQHRHRAQAGRLQDWV
jgi:hypothetical protein